MTAAPKGRRIKMEATEAHKAYYDGQLVKARQQRDEIARRNRANPQPSHVPDGSRLADGALADAEEAVRKAERDHLNGMAGIRERILRGDPVLTEEAPLSAGDQIDQEEQRDQTAQWATANGYAAPDGASQDGEIRALKREIQRLRVALTDE